MFVPCSTYAGLTIQSKIIEKKIYLTTTKKKRLKEKKFVSRRSVPCRNPGLNRGPLDLQSNALPTELFRLTKVYVCQKCTYIISNQHVL